MSPLPRTINMVVAALGGEGGAVLTDWLIATADRAGWLCQTTSLAGVAQRTGATIYYLEFFPRSAVPDGQAPVMSLFPAQGDIDIAVASEAAEAARMVQRGFVTPARTTLIASDHRVYGISEREHLSDGTINLNAVRQIAARTAKRFVHFDMLSIANQSGTPISAVMFGAIAGAAVLPFDRAQFEASIREGGKAVDANLAAFDSGYQSASAGGATVFDPTPKVDAPTPFTLPPAKTTEGAVLLESLKALPQACHELVYHALLKLVDYQDYEYASAYVQRIQAIAALDDGAASYALTRQSARYLCLLMCFEDIPRVAQLKIRQGREPAIRSEVLAEADQIIEVVEFFRPRVEEICAMLPAGLGRWMLGSKLICAAIKPFTGGRRLKTTNVLVYMALRLLAACRRFRRATLGYEHEYELIERWFGSVVNAASAGNHALAKELAEAGRLVKGYGDTRARTRSQLMSILGSHADNPERVASLYAAAIKDDSGIPFERELNATA